MAEFNLSFEEMVDMTKRIPLERKKTSEEKKKEKKAIKLEMKKEIEEVKRKSCVERYSVFIRIIRVTSTFQYINVVH